MLRKIKRLPKSPGLARLVVSLTIACLLSLILLAGCAPCSQYSQNPQNESFLSALLQPSCAPSSDNVFQFPAFQRFLGKPAQPDIFIEAWNILFRDYVDKDKLDAEKLSQAAIKGMIKALDDRYTSYLSPEDYKRRLESIRGKYQGIGARVAYKEEQIIIVAPMSGSPAEKAGIREEDRILEIDGESTAGMSLAEAVLRIKGPAGTSVTLLILHQGESEPVEMKIIRAEIKVQSVEFEMRSGLAYIKLSDFKEGTAEEFVDALGEAREKEASGIILDLRNNPGGSLQAVLDVASELLDGGVVLYIVDSEGERSALSAQTGGLANDLPLVVLINQYSASGSEVLAGALRDHGRATLAGNQTFGKGSVTIIRPLRDGSALNITSTRYVTPGGYPVEGLGLEPDFPLELEGDKLVDWAIDYLHSQRGQGNGIVLASLCSSLLMCQRVRPSRENLKVGIQARQ